MGRLGLGKKTIACRLYMNTYLFLNNHLILFIAFNLLPVKIMDDGQCWKQPKLITPEYEEVSSIEWELIEVTEQEEDLIYRMFRLVGERWDLIAGRIPGRKAEEIERFWILRNREGFAQKTNQLQS